MKILTISFKNLNSLKGEWFIDLTNNIYVSEGIFAITGPTGAGKTTIFDAVCLALYGRTPRLGRVSGSNEIMTRRTRECYAQVEFESGGTEYRALWQQEKAGRKLQSAKHILSEAKKNGRILTDKINETALQIQELTGMDFKRFTQAMMLEQGRFDAFLKANATERSEILELITGTEIYSEISARVYERSKAEHEKLEKLQLRLNEKKPNDPFGTDEEIQGEIDQIKLSLTQREREREDTRAEISWLKEIAKLLEELKQNQIDIETQNKRSDSFAADRERLEAGLRAQDLMPEYAALEAKRSALATSKTRCEKAESDITSFTERVTQITSQEIPNCEAKLKNARRDITESPETIYERVAGLVKTFEDAYTRKKNLEDSKARLEAEFAKAQAMLKTAQSDSSKAQAVYDDAERELGELLNIRTEVILDGFRRELRPGKPCPVCGSLEHPHVSKLSGLKSINFNEQLKKLQERKNYARKKYNEAKEKLMQTANYESKVRADLDNCMKELSQATDNFTNSRAAVSEAIESLGIYDAKTSSEILKRLKQWASGIKTLEQYLERFTKESDLLSSRIQTITKTLTEEKITLEALTTELDGLEKHFQASLIDKNIDSEQAFKDSRLSPDVLARLQAQAQSIEDRTKQLEAVRLDRTQKLEAKLTGGDISAAAAENNMECNKDPHPSLLATGNKITELESLLRTQEEAIKAIIRRSAELDSALQTRKKIREEYESINKEVKIQEKTYSDWSALNELIGTQNGSKYRKFAQKITLSMMIALANRQLEKLTERYTLSTAAAAGGDTNNYREELALYVIDKEQAGEIRPTTNLSGGERFIVSLALALGLSQISGSKARVDSLFLDEGFGSLDEDSLNTALEALAEVRREGRMIGIISHVQALKDRIRAQINVIPRTEGVSIIEGAGCKALS